MIDLVTIEKLPPHIATMMARAIAAKDATDDLFKMHQRLLNRTPEATAKVTAVIQEMHLAIRDDRSVTLAPGPTVALAAGSMSLMLGLLLQADPGKMP